MDNSIISIAPPYFPEFLTNSIKSEKMAYYKLSNTLYFR